MDIADIDKIENNIHAAAKYMRFVTDTFFRPTPRPTNSTGRCSPSPPTTRVRQRCAKLRRLAAKRGLDPNQWFGNVELVAADVIGREPVEYVSHILKYYVVYRRLAELGEERAQARDTGLETSAVPNSSSALQPATTDR